MYIHVCMYVQYACLCGYVNVWHVNKHGNTDIYSRKNITYRCTEYKRER